MLDRIWSCKDGRQLLISQMTTAHVRNCINLINRHPYWRQDYLDRLELELEIRRQDALS